MAGGWVAVAAAEVVGAAALPVGRAEEVPAAETAQETVAAGSAAAETSETAAEVMAMAGLGRGTAEVGTAAVRQAAAVGGLGGH